MSAIDNCLVVLNYNDYETTHRFVQMAHSCSSIDKIIIVDNCSPDGSFELLLQLKDEKTDVIKTGQNGGYAYGNNIGCKYAIDKYNPKYIFISNPDVQFQDKVIKDIQDALADNESIGVIAPLVNQGYNVWKQPGFLGVIESVFLIIHNLHKRKIKRDLIKKSKEIAHVGVVEGSFWCVKKDAFIKSDGLDEKTFLYYEENIFAKRLKNFGYTEAVLTKDRYDHFHSATIKKRYGGKARAFKHFHTGMKVYLSDYLKCNQIQIWLFEIAFFMGFVERIIFDLISFITDILGRK